jgi:hypothetical protein
MLVENIVMNSVRTLPPLEDEPQVTHMSRSKRPVFVVGCPRSGTSLLYHSLLSSGGFALYDEETCAFSGLVPRSGNLARPRNRRELLSQWQKSEYFPVDPAIRAEVGERILREGRNGGDFLRFVMEAIARRQNAERWAEKTPDHVLFLKQIRRTVPDALIIHIVRDGRDVALSLSKIGFLKDYLLRPGHNLLVCGLYWEWLVESGRKAAPRLAPDYLEVRFEDLVGSPRDTLAQIGKFIDHDLDYDRIQRNGFHTVARPNSSFSDSSAGYFDPVKRWAKGLSPSKLADLESLIGPTLLRLGYELGAPQNHRSGGLRLRSLRSYYRSYFALRLWAKCSQLPLVKHLIRDRQ